MDKRHRESADARGKIDGYLQRSGLAQQSPRVVPLTGDASDRRYFRVLVPEEQSIVLSLYSAPFQFDTLPFVNVARLLEKMPVPIPAVLGHAEEPRCIARQSRSSRRCSGAGRNWNLPTTCRTGARSTSRS